MSDVEELLIQIIVQTSGARNDMTNIKMMEETT
jgi:hypothetical protein